MKILFFFLFVTFFSNVNSQINDSIRDKIYATKSITTLHNLYHYDREKSIAQGIEVYYEKFKLYHNTDSGILKNSIDSILYYKVEGIDEKETNFLHNSDVNDVNASKMELYHYLKLSELHKCKYLGYIEAKNTYKWSKKIDFTSFPNLREVSIEQELTSKQLKDLLITAKNLRVLEIRVDSVVPDCLCDLKNLSFLKISSSSNLELPDCIDKLTNLKWLGIGGLSKKLNKVVWNIPSLEYLEIKGGELSNIPASIKNMIHLKQINLGNVQPINFPKEIGFLDSLELININNIDILDRITVNFPTEFNQLKELRAIHLANIDLKKFPDFSNSKKLISIHFTNINNYASFFDNVELEHVSEPINDTLDLTGLSQLKYLKLDNVIMKYPNGFPKGMESLASLEQFFNKNAYNITEIPEYFSKLANLRLLCLLGTTNLKYPPESNTLSCTDGYFSFSKSMNYYTKLYKDLIKNQRDY